MLGNYEDFKKIIYNLTNIDLSYYKERQMKRRIDALIDKRGFKKYSSYVFELKQNKVLYDEFLTYITINVSEFFRNPEQWKVLEEEVLPQILENNIGEIRVWSAACSSGDEPYSLAMLLSKHMPNSKIKIYATDIDSQILEQAQIGLYNIKSLKGVPEDMLAKHFKQINETTYQISDKIKSFVEFSRHNLLKDNYHKNLDLIVCRNVLIYFTDEAKDMIYKGFHNSLKNKGFLFIGSTEQIIQPNLLGYKNFKSFFYQKNQNS